MKKIAITVFWTLIACQCTLALIWLVYFRQPQPLLRDIAFDTGRNSFVITVNSRKPLQLALNYKTPHQLVQKPGAQLQNSSVYVIYAGDCAGARCTSDTVLGGLFKLQQQGTSKIEAYYFEMRDHRLHTLKTDTSQSSAKLLASEQSWFDHFQADGVVLAASTLDCAPVIPEVNCIEPLSNNRFRARFNYNNTNPFSVEIPVSYSNRFAPGADDQGQPTVFRPGLKKNAISITVSGDSLTWFLHNSQATATAQSSQCIVPTLRPTRTPTPTPSPTPRNFHPTATATPRPTRTHTPTPRFSPTPRPTNTPTPTPVLCDCVTPTNTPVPTRVITLTPTPTRTPTPTPTATSTPTPVPTITPVAPTSNPQPTPTPMQTPTETPTLTPTNSPTPSPTVTLLPTGTPSLTPTATLTPSPTATPTPIPTQTPSPTPTPTVTSVPTPTLTPTVAPFADLVVDAGPDTTITLPELAVMDATLHSVGLREATLVTTQWEAVAGPGEVTFMGSGLSPQIEFAQAGTHVLQLTATTDQTGPRSDTVTVTARVQSVNPTPVATPTGSGDVNGATDSSSPENLSLALLINNVQHDTATVSWLPPSTPVTHYSLTYGTDQEALQYTKPNIGLANNFTLFGLLPDTVYYLSLKSWRGNALAGLSRTLAFHTPDSPYAFNPASKGFDPTKRLSQQLQKLTGESAVFTSVGQVKGKSVIYKPQTAKVSVACKTNPLGWVVALFFLQVQLLIFALRRKLSQRFQQWVNLIFTAMCSIFVYLTVCRSLLLMLALLLICALQYTSRSSGDGYQGASVYYLPTSRKKL